MLRVKKIVFFLLCFVAVEVSAQNLDVRILKSINVQVPDSKSWNAASNSVYWFPATSTFTTLATGFIQNDRQLKHNGYELLISAGISTLISSALKVAFNRTRPADKYPNKIFVTAPAVHGHSFPSGHTTLAFATATTLALQYKKWYVVAPSFLWAGLVGYSRMYKGRHYPSDVLAGIIVGIAGGMLSHYMIKNIERK